MTAPLIAGALIAGWALSAGAASAQRFQPAYPIVQHGAEPEQPPAAPAGEEQAPAIAPDSRAYNAGQTIGDIVSQPTKDIGINKTQIPEVLTRAEASPYAMADTANCARMQKALAELDEALGPDYTVERTEEGSRAGKIAAAGGRAVVNSIIPFRGIVREVTGAADADRRYASAVDAGIARRGFLRGLQTAQGCDADGQTRAARR
jgi:hypothetical protein